MLYGTLPFKGLTPREIKERVFKGKYIMKKSISEGARSLIAAMMCVEVDNRISLEEILNEPWLISAPAAEKVQIFNPKEVQIMVREFFYLENKSEWPNHIVKSIDPQEHNHLFQFTLQNL